MLPSYLTNLLTVIFSPIEAIFSFSASSIFLPQSGQVEPKNSSTYKNLIVLYMKNKKYSSAKSTLSNLLYRVPSAKDDPQVQSFIKDLQK